MVRVHERRKAVRYQHRAALALVGMLATAPFAMSGNAQTEQQTPQVEIPKPGVPQIMTLEGAYVRAAYNNEGYVILGYRTANASVGQDWLLLEIGATMRSGQSYTLHREAVSLDVPNGETIALASVEDYRAANLVALQQRNKVLRDSIDYFPPGTNGGCRLGFFSELGSRAMPWNEVELSTRRACMGQLFFKVPGGITYGQHWLNVKLQDTVVRVPFRILTKEEDKLLTKNYLNIKKQVDETFKKK
jgi:hypothetical protein